MNPPLSQEIRIAMLAVAQGRPIPAPRPLLIDEADIMNHEELAKTVGEMKETAAMFVRRHAAISAPDVSAAMVDSICQALGDISIDEATAALDRLQAEQRRAVLLQDAKEGRIIECPPR